jgi:hypothetical protein
MPTILIDAGDTARRLIDLQGAEALPVALKQSLMLLNAGHLLTAAAMARAAAMISDIEKTASPAGTLALG